MGLFDSQIVKFIKEQFPKEEKISLHAPIFQGNEKKYLIDAIDSTFVSSVGSYVDKFEEMIGEISNSKKGVAVVNGTAALQVAMQLAGVVRGDEVVTQALTFIATINAINYTGAEPIFLDVDLDTMGLSPLAVEEFLDTYGELRNGVCFNKKTNKRISACVPMHTFGFPVRMDELSKICSKWKIPIVEDAAEALGSEYKSQPCGTIGEIGVFSFNGNKIATSGGGGAIISKNIEYIKRGKYLTTTAKMPHPYEFVHDEIGYNYRMPNINAALAVAQLEQLNDFLRIKRNLALRYQEYFIEIGINFKSELPDTKANYWLNCIELENRQERDNFLNYSNANGVMTRPIWQLIYKMPMYAHCFKDAQKNAEYLESRIVNIPSSVCI
jgi:perosamine synthetase